MSSMTIKVRTFDEQKLSVRERTKIRAMIAERFDFPWKGSVIDSNDLPVLLANMRIDDVPMDMFPLLRKASQ